VFISWYLSSLVYVGGLCAFEVYGNDESVIDVSVGVGGLCAFEVYGMANQ
jgi:hypothetical protein